MFGWTTRRWRARTRRWAMRRRPVALVPAARGVRRRVRGRAPRRLSGPLLALLGTLVVAGVLAVGGPQVAHAQGDDGELRPRLEAACARIPSANERVQQAITRLDAAATERGSLAWFEAAVARATANGRPRIAADLQRRLDRLTDRRALLDVRVSQLERLQARCVDLGVEVGAEVGAGA